MLYILCICFSVSWQVHIHNKVEQEVWMCTLACSISMALLLQYRVQTLGVLPPSVRFIRSVSLVGVFPIAYGPSWAFDFGRPVRYFACCKTEGSKACQITRILCFWCWSWHPLDSFSQKDSSIWLDVHAGLSWSFQLVKYIYLAEGPMFCLS